VKAKGHMLYGWNGNDDLCIYYKEKGGGLCTTAVFVYYDGWASGTKKRTHPSLLTVLYRYDEFSSTS
jgi:hypothetical protein